MEGPELKPVKPEADHAAPDVTSESGAPHGEVSDVNKLFEVPYNWWKATGQQSALEDQYYAEDPRRFWRYEAKPPGIMVPFGTLAILLLAGQMFVPPHTWMSGRDDLTGVLRLAMLMLGGFCAFHAWPHYRDRRMTPEEVARTEEVRERIHQLQDRRKPR